MRHSVKHSIYCIISLAALLFVGITEAFAQMTDAQVLNMAKEKLQSGMSQREVAVELMSKGATREQLQRLYNSSQGSNRRTSTTLFNPEETEILRENNGETLPDYGFYGEYWMPETAPMPQDPKTQVYGRNIFRNRNLSFEPAMNVATPAEYVLGPGDQLVVDIYGSSQQSTTHTISPDGTVTLEKAGPVNVAGLTVKQANARMKSAIGGYYEDSDIRVTVGQTRTIVVNVFGEVAVPGTYKLSAFATVFNALYLAGGTSDIGTLRDIRVLRNGKVITHVDVYDYIQSGNLSGNIMLKDNDVIMVDPYDNLVSLQGKVKRPMMYELKSSESITDLLNFAGGFTGDAYKDKVRVERRGDEGLTVHTVASADFSKFHLADADTIFVEDIIERYKNMASVEGAVFRPGRYTIGTQVYSVRTLVEQAGGLHERAMTTRAVLQRMQEDRTYKNMSIDLAGIMTGKATDVVLNNEDRLVIGSYDQLLNEQTVEIVGEVFNPGVFPYAANRTIEDLITEAGGLRESASLLNVEIARRITKGADQEHPDQVARVYQYSLSEGLAFGDETPFYLEPYDIVTIHPDPTYFKQTRVYINGEVKYRGVYILTEKAETLSSLINRSGGLTDKAYAAGATLTRLVDAEDKSRQKQVQELAKRNGIKDSTLLVTDESTYLVGIDLEEAINHPGSMADIVLQEGDIINIPQINNIVKINGEVLHTNTVSYREGKKYKYYIDQAGGFTKQARKHRAYVVYANGQVSRAAYAEIKPGCEIIVPSKPDKAETAQNATMWISMTSALATVAAVLVSALRLAK